METNPKQDGAIPFLGLVLFGGLTAFALLVWLILVLATDPVTLGPIGFDWAWLWFTLSFWYILLSWRFYTPVKADETGIRSFLGRPIDTVEAGAPYVPLGLFQLDTFKRSVVQREFPAEPEFVYEGEMKDREKLPDGMKPPIRITFRDSIDESELPLAFKDSDITVAEFSRINLPQLRHMLQDEEKKKLIHSDFWSDYSLSQLEGIEKLEEVPKTTLRVTVPDDGLTRRVTANVTPVVRWRVRNAIDFLRNIGGNPNEVDRQIEDEMVSVLQRLLPKMSAAQALENMDWINAHLFDAVIRRTLGWGIVIEGAYLKRIPFHHKLNIAIGAASEAEFTGRADRELAIKRGEGTARARKDLLQAEAAGEKAMLTARAEGQKKIVEDLGLSGAEVQAAEVARALADGGNTVIMGTDGFAQLGGIVAAMAKNKQPQQPPPATPPAKES